MNDSVFGKYRLIAELGSGGMADVYLALAHGPAGLGFSKLFVIKRLRANLAGIHEFAEMLVDEARIAARLNHPNVVQTYEIGQVENQYYIAMEYLEGQPLARFLNRARVATVEVPLGVRLRILADGLAGLHHAHTLKDFDGTPLNIVHRDVSPHNLFVTYEGQTKVVDFGIAKAMGRSVETRTGIIKGKVAYMSPEQPTGGELDGRADVFSVGVILWEFITGTRYWKNVDDLTILARLVNDKLPGTPRSVKPDVPADLEEVCTKALHFDPEKRYASAREFQRAIEAYMDSAGINTSQSEVGDFLREFCEDKRREVAAIIERQLTQLRAGNLSEFEAVPLKDLLLTSTPATTGRGGYASGQSETTGTTLAAPATLRRPNRARKLVLGAVASVALAAFAYVMAFKPVAPAAPEAANVTAATRPGTAEPDHVRVSLRASPPSARILLDDRALENPYVGTMQKDSAVHKLLVQAPGFADTTRELTLDEDQSVEVALVPVLPASPASARATPKRGTTDLPLPGRPLQRPKHKIDEADPWNQ
jgi:serine/threonine-protein kinase